eukprot:g7961.t1
MRSLREAPGGKLDLWNAENSFAKVQPCDYVAEVNGESGVEAMMKELQKRSAVRLRILRFSPTFQVTFPSIEQGRVVGLKYDPPMNNHECGLVIKEIVPRPASCTAVRRCVRRCPHMLPCVLGLLSLGAVHGAPKPYVGIYNASCWGPGFSQEMCCNQAFSERGMAACWVDGYSFEYCCPPPLGVFRSSGAYVGHQPHIYDKGFGPALVKFFQSRRATTVLDLGAGAGWYVVSTILSPSVSHVRNRRPASTGTSRSASPLRRNPSVRMVSEKRCWHADLSEDWDLGQRWSWVMSIEVAEHVPKAFEKTYVDNLDDSRRETRETRDTRDTRNVCGLELGRVLEASAATDTGAWRVAQDRHSCEGLVISWAPPFQAGGGHVNWKTQAEVEALLKPRGFWHNQSATTWLRGHCHHWWIQRNVMVFERRTAELHECRDEVDQGGPKQNLQKRLSCSMDVVPDMPGELSWGSKQKNRVKSTNSSSSKTSQRSSANSPHRKAVEDLPQGIGSELQRATSKMSHSSRGEQSPGRSIIKNSHGLRKSVSFGPEASFIEGFSGVITLFPPWLGAQTSSFELRRSCAKETGWHGCGGYSQETTGCPLLNLLKKIHVVIQNGKGSPAWVDLKELGSAVEDAYEGLHTVVKGVLVLLHPSPETLDLSAKDSTMLLNYKGSDPFMATVHGVITDQQFWQKQTDLTNRTAGSAKEHFPILKSCFASALQAFNGGCRPEIWLTTLGEVLPKLDTLRQGLKPGATSALEEILVQMIVPVCKFVASAKGAAGIDSDAVHCLLDNLALFNEFHLAKLNLPELGAPPEIAQTLTKMGERLEEWRGKMASEIATSRLESFAKSSLEKARGQANLQFDLEEFLRLTGDVEEIAEELRGEIFELVALSISQGMDVIEKGFPHSLLGVNDAEGAGQKLQRALLEARSGPITLWLRRADKPPEMKGDRLRMLKSQTSDRLQDSTSSTPVHRSLPQGNAWNRLMDFDLASTLPPDAMRNLVKLQEDERKETGLSHSLPDIVGPFLSNVVANAISHLEDDPLNRSNLMGHPERDSCATAALPLQSLLSMSDAFSSNPASPQMATALPWPASPDAGKSQASMITEAESTFELLAQEAALEAMQEAAKVEELRRAAEAEQAKALEAIRRAQLEQAGRWERCRGSRVIIPPMAELSGVDVAVAVGQELVEFSEWVTSANENSLEGALKTLHRIEFVGRPPYNLDIFSAHSDGWLRWLASWAFMLDDAFPTRNRLGSKEKPLSSPPSARSGSGSDWKEGDRASVEWDVSGERIFWPGTIVGKTHFVRVQVVQPGMAEMKDCATGTEHIGPLRQRIRTQVDREDPSLFVHSVAFETRDAKKIYTTTLKQINDQELMNKREELAVGEVLEWEFSQPISGLPLWYTVQLDQRAGRLSKLEGRRLRATKPSHVAPEPLPWPEQGKVLLEQPEGSSSISFKNCHPSGGLPLVAKVLAAQKDQEALKALAMVFCHPNCTSEKAQLPPGSYLSSQAAAQEALRQAEAEKAAAEEARRQAEALAVQALIGHAQNRAAEDKAQIEEEKQQKQLRDGKEVEVDLPEGLKAGEIFHVLFEGEEYELEVPEGMQPGQTMREEGHVKIQLVVPNDFAPGDSLVVEHEGKEYEVMLPDDVQPGETVKVTLEKEVHPPEMTTLSQESFRSNASLFSSLGGISASASISIGSFGRLFVQQGMFRLGIWAAIPFTLLHFIMALLALLYVDQEWAVYLEIVGMVGFDIAIAIEGLTFDVWSDSEVMVKDAQSTVLSVFTLSYAVGVTCGGILYDFFSWRGMAAYHALQLAAVVPSPRAAGAEEDLTVVDLTESQNVKIGAAESINITPHRQQDQTMTERGLQSESTQGWQRGVSASSAQVQEQLAAAAKEVVDAASGKRPGAVGRLGGGTFARGTTVPATPTAEAVVARAVAAVGGLAGETARSHATHRSVRSDATALSRMTRLSDAGELFQFHHAVQNSLHPRVAAAGVIMGFGNEDYEIQSGLAERTKQDDFGGRNVYLPMALIVFTNFVVNSSYSVEWCIFAEQHGWESATWAGICQTSGDLLAAVIMNFVTTGRKDLDEYSGCCWYVQAIIAQPYNLNLFYSLGNFQVFLAMQVFCRNADAIGALLAGFGGYALYEVYPNAPFFLTSALALFGTLIFIAGFCSRVGFGLDIETAEARRARRVGSNRVSIWKSELRKTHKSLDGKTTRETPGEATQRMGEVDATALPGVPDSA